MKYILLFLLIFSNILLANTLNLTLDEKNWLKNNPTIKIAVMNYWNHDGDGNSIHTDYLRLLNRYGDINIIPIRYDAWKDGYSQIIDKENNTIHAIMNLSWSKEREKNHFFYTKAYNFEPNYLVTRKSNNNITNLHELKTKTVLVKEKSITYNIVEEISDDINIIQVKSDLAMYKQLFTDKEIDAFITYNTDKKILKKYNLKIVKTIYDKFSEVSIGVSKKYPHLQSIINKINNIIPKGKLSKLRDNIYSDIQPYNTQDLNSKYILTDKDKEYIKQKPYVTIAMMSNFKPFSFIENDLHQGLSVDILQNISKISGLKFNIQTSSWSESLSKFREKKVDMISGISYTKKRDTFSLFTKPFFEIPTYIFGLKSDTHYKNIKDLKGKKVGVSKDIFYLNTLKKLGIDVIEYKGSTQKAKALALGNIDYFLSSFTSGKKAITSQSFTNIKPLDEFKGIKKEDLRYGINKENKILHSIIEKSLNQIRLNQLEQLINKWIIGLNKPVSENSVHFTNKEGKYLKNKKVIKMCVDPSWMPFEKIAKGKHIGLASDYIKIIENSINIPIRLVKTKDWDESIKKAKNRECDIFSMVPIIEERKEYMDFTSAYLDIPMVIATKTDNQFIDDISQILDKKIGIVKNYSIAKILKKKHPNINIVEVKSIDDGLEKVESGKIFAFIDNLATVNYTIQKKFMNSVKVSGRLNNRLQYRVATRNDEPTLHDIFEKVILNIDINTKEKIFHKWVNPPKKEEVINYTLMWQILFIVSIIIIFIIYRQVILKKQNQKLEDSINVFEAILDSALEGILIFDSDSKCIEVNNKALEILKIKDKSNIIGQNIFNFVSQQSVSIVKENIKMNNAEPSEITLIRDNGENFPALVRGRTTTLNGKSVRISSVLDMTDIKHKEELLLLQSKMASMGEMIGNIAHQWRQPLSVISTGATGMKMQKEYGLLTDDEFYKYCDAIDDNAQYLSKTIDDFKNFIKGDRTKNIFNLKNSINSFLHLIEGSIKSNDIKMILTLQEDIQLDGYENELTQCLINIFNNSKDILNEKNIQNKYLFISTSKTKDNVIIKIKDNGDGIPTDIINKIFEPYFTTKHQSQGTGLGLHMTYNLIVEGMSGSIEVDNKTYTYEDKKYVGAEFVISLPL